MRERMDKLRQWMRTSAKSKSEGQLDLLKRPIQSLFLWIILVNIVLILVIGLCVISSFALWKYVLGPVDDRHFEEADSTVFSHNFIHRALELLATLFPFVVSLAMLKKKRNPAKNARYVMHAQFQLVILLVSMGMILFGNIYIKRTPFSAFQLFYVNCLLGIAGLFAFRQERLVPAEYQNPHLHRFIWKNAIGHAIFQLTVLILLILGAERLVPELTSARDPIYTHVPTTHMTFVFCVFELMTLFNMFNCRVLVGENRGSKIYKGLGENNRLFLPIWICLFLLHVLGILLLMYTLPLNLSVRVVRLFFFSRPLTFRQWRIALLISLSVLFWAKVVMLLPPKAKLMSNSISGRQSRKAVFGPGSESWGQTVERADIDEAKEKI